MIDRLPALAAALWWGSLTTIGFLVVPMLFASLPSPTMAGYMAAKLFAAQTWVTVACCLVLLLLSGVQFMILGVLGMIAFVILIAASGI